jgi:hypothetical protein
MAWKSLTSGRNYLGYWDGSTKLTTTNWIKLAIEYEDTSNCVTELKIRFVGTCYDNSKYTKYGFYVLINPGKSNEDLRLVKYKGNSWGLGTSWSGAKASTTSTITLYKDATEESFTIPEYWLCNTGSVLPDTTDRTITYDDHGKRSMYWYFREPINGETGTLYTRRKNFKQAWTSFKDTGVSLQAKPVTAKKPTITDNGNNTFTVKAEKGTAGDNNSVKSTTLKYKISTNSEVTASSLTPGAVSLPTGIAAAKQPIFTVKAHTVVTGTYGNEVSSEEASSDIKNYQAPKTPGKPIISHSKSRLTIKEPWKYSWTKAEPTNDSSPVAGYSVVVYKEKAGSISIPKIKGIKKGNYVEGRGYELKLNASGNNEAVDIPATDPSGNTLEVPSVFFDPVEFGFEPGGKVKLGVVAYALNGKSEKLAHSSIYRSSELSEIQGAGIVRVKTSSGWKEGQVYVKTSGGWKEAESVQIKTDKGWKESE